MPGKRTDKGLQYLEDLQASHPSLATAIQQFAGDGQLFSILLQLLSVYLPMHSKQCIPGWMHGTELSLCCMQISTRGSSGIS